MGEAKVLKKKGSEKNPKNPYVIVTKAYIYVMLTVFLFFTGTRGYLTIQDDKFRAFCLICGGYVVIMAVLALERLVIGQGGVVSPKKLLLCSTWPQRLAAAYLLLTWASALLSDYFPETVIGGSRYEGALTISIYVLSFILLSVYGRPDRPMLAVAGVSIALFSALALVQILLDCNPFNLFPEGYSYSDSYVEFPSAFAGTIGNIDFVAAFLCLAIPLLWISLVKQRGAARFALTAPLLLALALLVCLGVLAGFVGAGFGALLCLPCVFFKKPRARIIYFAALAALMALGVLTLYFFDAGGGLLHELHEILHGRASGSFGSGRLHIWQGVLAKLPEHPLLGFGPDTMIHAGLEAFTRYDESLGATIVAEIDAAHNEYLNIAFHQGIPALALYLAMLVIIARDWAVNCRDAAVCALGGAALCYCVQAFFGISTCITSPFFWLAIGLMEGQVRRISTNGGKKVWQRNS